MGAGEILLTSMDCDGMKTGYDIALTRQVSEAVSVPVIASGGAGTKEHFFIRRSQMERQMLRLRQVCSIIRSLRLQI